MTIHTCGSTSISLSFYRLRHHLSYHISHIDITASSQSNIPPLPPPPHLHHLHLYQPRTTSTNLCHYHYQPPPATNHHHQPLPTLPTYQPLRPSLPRQHYNPHENRRNISRGVNKKEQATQCGCKSTSEYGRDGTESFTMKGEVEIRKVIDRTGDVSFLLDLRQERSGG